MPSEGGAFAPPPIPNIFTGSVTIDGEPAADKIEIYVEIVKDNVVYATPSVLVSDGKYIFLKVGPPSEFYDDETINFYAWIDGAGVQAAETVPFDAYTSLLDPFIDLDLTFTMP